VIARWRDRGASRRYTRRGRTGARSAFTSLSDIGGDAYPFLPVRWLLRGELDTRSSLARLRIPVLIFHGRRDEVIPTSRTCCAARRLPHSEFVEILGYHNERTWMETPEVVRRIGACASSNASRSRTARALKRTRALCASTWAEIQSRIASAVARAERSCNEVVARAFERPHFELGAGCVFRQRCASHSSSSLP
jgi:hypothetical protein